MFDKIIESMKKMWKNVLGIVLVAAISAGAAVGDECLPD